MPPYRGRMAYWRVTFADTYEAAAPWPRLLQIQHHRVDSARYRLASDRSHWPERWAFKYTMDGTGEVEIEGVGVAALPPGVGLLFRIDDNRVRPRFPERARSPWTWLTIQFSGADAVAEDLVARHGHLFAMDGDAPVMRQALAHRKDDGRCLRLSPESTASRVLDVLAALDADGRSEVKTDPVEHALAIIAAGTGRHHHVAALAQEVGLHPDHLSRLVHDRTGAGLKEHMQRHRFQNACELLRDTDLPVAVIAERCGFATPSSFGRSFRQRYGCAPGAWRGALGK